MDGPYPGVPGETDRLLTLSDGVIAIVITLLVLDIGVPTVPDGTTSSQVEQLVLGQWQEFVGFALSFAVIGLYWMLHRRLFVHVQDHERGVVYLNLLFLLVVAFVPYATSVFTTYPSRFGVQFLSGVLALTGFALAVLWSYASRNDLLAAGLTSRGVQIQAVRFLATPLVFLGAVVIAFFDGGIAILSWLLVIPVQGALDSRFLEDLDASTTR